MKQHMSQATSDPASLFRNFLVKDVLNRKILHTDCFRVQYTIQFGTQVKFRWSRDHNNRTAENAFSAPWYYSEMELEPVAG